MDYQKLFNDYGFKLSDNQLQQFDLYSDLLISWNQKFNLTAIVNKEEIYVKHFLDCLFLTNKLDSTGSLADVGSGAGFPGIVVKIFYPDLDITLLEPNNKKVLFLNTVIEKLKLDKIQVVNQRAEDFAKENFQSFDFVTARAVASLNILMELTVPLIKVNGNFLAMKGPKGQEELDNCQNALTKLDCEVKEIYKYNVEDNNREIIVLNKIKDTNSKYPRNYGQIKKKPL